MKYKTVLADPPWPMPETGATTRGETDSKGVYTAKGGRKVNGCWWGRHRGGTVKLPYPTMSIAQIESIPVRELAEKDAHLYLWTTNRFLEDGFFVARAWGFEVSQVLTWCKPPMGNGFGGAFCSTTEFILFCRRGSLPPKRRVDSTWWNWSRPYENGHPKHSAKPEEFIRVLESVSPGPYVELFARPWTPLFQKREGWDVWGNEVKPDLQITPSGLATNQTGLG